MAINERGVSDRLKQCDRQLPPLSEAPEMLQPLMLNADANLVSIQDLLGHSRNKTPQRRCNVSNLQVQRDYFKAMQASEPTRFDYTRPRGKRALPNQPIINQNNENNRRLLHMACLTRIYSWEPKLESSTAER
jgi:hypothetical protein